jgi:glycosyltransferase involved in cell wall biosynthesis
LFLDKADVLFIGRLTREKGFDIFLKLADTTDFSINFKALGSISSCDFTDLANIKNVELLGHVPKEQVYDFLDKTKILIMPSVADGFGFVVLEALARGVIVICSDNTGASDLINHGYNGFIFKTGELDSLLQIFTNVMNSKYNLMEIRKNAINTAKEFDVSSYEKSIAHYIQSTLNT